MNNFMLFSGIGLSLKDNEMIPKKNTNRPNKRIQSFLNEMKRTRTVFIHLAV